MTEHDNRLFHSGEKEAQQRWDTKDIWTAERKQRLLWDKIPEEFHSRIESTPFFFIATSDPDGNCDCSFKGGGPGLIRMLSETRFAFSDFNGNGAFMSLGNILLNPHIGCLFIDFSTRDRLRVNGRATIHESGEVMSLFPEAPRIVTVDIEQVVPNCKAHVPILVQPENVFTEEDANE